MKKDKLISKTFMVKVFDSKEFNKMYVLKLVNDNKFLPRTFKTFLPGVKSGDVVSFDGTLYKNEKGYDSLFIKKETIKLV